MTDEFRFTCGDCYILARRIHRITGWPMHCFLYPGCSVGPQEHAFVVTPAGTALDVTGEHSLPSFRKKWGNLRHREFSRAEMRAWDHTHWNYKLRRAIPAGPVFGHYSYQRARVVADQLVNEWRKQHGERVD